MEIRYTLASLGRVLHWELPLYLDVILRRWGGNCLCIVTDRHPQAVEIEVKLE